MATIERIDLRFRVRSGDRIVVRHVHFEPSTDEEAAGVRAILFDTSLAAGVSEEPVKIHEHADIPAGLLVLEDLPAAEARGPLACYLIKKSAHCW
jgi:hypothetical protein